MPRQHRPAGQPDGGQFAPSLPVVPPVPSPSDISEPSLVTEEPSFDIIDYVALMHTGYQRRQPTNGQAERLRTVEEDNDAAESYVPVRCLDCGEYANDNHMCAPLIDDDTPLETATFAALPYYSPVTQQVEERSVSYRIPSRETLVVQLARHREVAWWIDLEHSTILTQSTVYGRTFIRQTEENKRTVDLRSMKCRCSDYDGYSDCEHLRGYRFAVEDYVGALSRDEQYLRNANERARVLTEGRFKYADATETDWTLNPITAAEAARTWMTGSDGLYSADPRLFLEDMRAERDRAKANDGLPCVPYRTENVLNGACQRGSGQGFGVEIEYEFPQKMGLNAIREANKQIGAELYEAGITSTREQLRYHASQRYGAPTDEHTSRGYVWEGLTMTGEKDFGTWSFEEDSTAAGEIVTPIMYDEPDTWERLETTMRILQRNGAVAGIRSGSHVHVGTGPYEGSPAAYAELGRIVTQHEDVLMRLASSPQRGTHRNTNFAKVLPPVPPQGFTSVSAVKSWQSDKVGRNGIVNFATCNGAKDDHVEFRVFDSSLDPGTVQAQIVMAVGMVNAAKRNAQNGGTGRGKEKWGTHAEEKKPRTASDIVRESGTLMSFIDTIVQRRDDKAQLAAIAYHTEWSEPLILDGKRHRRR